MTYIPHAKTPAYCSEHRIYDNTISRNDYRLAYYCWWLWLGNQPFTAKSFTDDYATPQSASLAISAFFTFWCHEKPLRKEFQCHPRFPWLLSVSFWKWQQNSLIQGNNFCSCLQTEKSNCGSDLSSVYTRLCTRTGTKTRFHYAGLPGSRLLHGRV